MASPSEESSSSKTPPPDVVLRIALLRVSEAAGIQDKETMERGFDLGKLNCTNSSGSEWRELNPTIWRTFRCSSGINLDVFQDKVLQPIFGWSRNYHAYWFEKYPQPKSGKEYYYCPKYGGIAEYPDLMSWGDRAEDGEHLDPRKYTLGDLFQKAGDACRYVYDFGDFWVHSLTCEQVIPYDESVEDDDSETKFGAIQVLNGAMQCPDEDGRGSEDYQEEVLDKLLRVKKDKTNKKFRYEYSKACFDRVNALNVVGMFDPEHFDIDERQQALNDALHSTMSCRSGPKMPGGGLSGMSMLGSMGSVIDAVRLEPGQRKFQTPQQDTRFGHGAGNVGVVTVSEVVNCRPDDVKFRLCYYCGNPWNTKACARCRTACYCSSECQVADWKSHHKKCCKNKWAKDFEAFQAEKAGTKRVPNEGVVQPMVSLKYFDPDNMRFKVGDQVECSMAENTYIKATVIRVLPRGDSGNIVAYQCELNYPDCKKVGAKRGQCIWAIWDHDYIIRAAV